MISRINTEELREIAATYNLAVRDFECEIRDLFKRMENVPRGTKEWIGTQADFYFSQVALDIPKFKSFIEDLRQFGNLLEETAAKADATINANNT